MRRAPPFLQGAYVVPDRVGDPARCPFNRALVRDLALRLDSAVTILVGENGCGKSTLLQALAVLSRLPATGGGRAELGFDHGQAGATGSALADAMRPQLKRHPRDAWYFRADMHTSFATALAARGGHHAYARAESPDDAAQPKVWRFQPHMAPSGPANAM